MNTEVALDKIGYMMRFSHDFVCEDNVSNNRKCGEVDGEFNVHRRLIHLNFERRSTRNECSCRILKSPLREFNVVRSVTIQKRL